MSFARDFFARNELSVGESTIPRMLCTGSNNSGNGQARFTYFTARKSETINSLRMFAQTGSSGATLRRMGIYSVAANGNMSLLASTPNDTTLWTANTTLYTKALSTPFTKVRGVRYAFCVLEVNSGTLPTFATFTSSSGSAEMATSPRLSGYLASQTDLPNTVTPGSNLPVALWDTTIMYYAVMVP